jgi:hypothetical protein
MVAKEASEMDAYVASFNTPDLVEAPRDSGINLTCVIVVLNSNY